MSTDRFVVLQAEFELLSKRLQKTEELSERQAILKDVRKILAEMDEFIETRQRDLQKKLDKIRENSN